MKLWHPMHVWNLSREAVREWKADGAPSMGAISALGSYLSGGTWSEALLHAVELVASFVVLTLAFAAIYCSRASRWRGATSGWARR